MLIRYCVECGAMTFPTLAPWHCRECGTFLTKPQDGLDPLMYVMDRGVLVEWAEDAYMHYLDTHPYLPAQAYSASEIAVVNGKMTLRLAA